MDEQLARLPPRARLLFVQFGDYLEADERLTTGGEEIYASQRYTVDFVAKMAGVLERVSVLTLDRDHDPQTTTRGVHCRGLQLYPARGGSRHRELIEAASAERPTHLIVRSPLAPLLHWASGQGIPVLPMLADSFRLSGLRARFRAWRLARELNREHVQWVANHNIAASLDLARIGVDPAKILPYDTPHSMSPQDFAPKDAPAGETYRMLYVGRMSESKGVGDLVRAVEVLRNRGRDVSLDLIGEEAEFVRELAGRRGVEEHVQLLGKLPHQRVMSLMNTSDVLLVPSRHEYPEGLPLTIYEGLCSRTPVVISDHPMFRIRMVDGENCVMHRAGDPEAIADAVLRALEEDGLYVRLSHAAERAADDYLCPLEWSRLMTTWLDPDPAVRASLGRFSLAETGHVGQGGA